MLTPTKKGQYALRAIYELARRKDDGPIKISIIAEAQAIPPRFLEVILNQFKGSGLVESKRGFYGGYSLTREPSEITVGDILRYLQKEMEASHCIACVSKRAARSRITVCFPRCGIASRRRLIKSMTKPPCRTCSTPIHRKRFRDVRLLDERAMAPRSFDARISRNE